MKVKHVRKGGRMTYYTDDANKVEYELTKLLEEKEQEDEDYS